MVFLTRIIDAVLFVFFLVFSLAAPFDVGMCLEPDYQPTFLLNIKPLYPKKYGEHLVNNKPGFFIALVLLEVFFQWPLAVMNLYGLLGGKQWFGTTSLIFGASYSTSMLAVAAELISSHTVSDKLLKVYFLLIACGILTVFRGLLSHYGETTSTQNRPALSKKKRT